MVMDLNRRKFLRAGVGGVALAAVAGQLGAPSAVADDQVFGEAVDLGVAMTSVNTRYAVASALPDGTPVIYEISQGTPSSFNVVNASDGTRISAFTLEQATSASAIAVSPDRGFVYFAMSGGGRGFLHRYDVTKDEVSLLATDPAGQRMTRNLVIADDGMVYASTFPNAKVYSYDPTTDQLHDYGSVTDDGTYAWGLELVDGKVWVGTGIGTAHLVVLDPATGDMHELALPDHAAGATNIHQIARRGDLVIGVYTPSANGTNSLVYDLSTEQWLPPDTMGVMALNGAMTPLTADGVFYYQSGNDGIEICSFDPATLTSTPTGWRETPAGKDRTGLQNMGLLEIAGAPVIAGMLLTARHWLFNPADGGITTVDADILGSPIAVHTLHVGPGDNVYTGAHLSSGVMGMINTRTDAVTELSGPSQADAVTALDGHIVVGCYPGAKVYVGDGRDWDWGTNPSLLFELGRFGEYEQDRPRALVPAGEQIAMGTVPNYGEVGGALTFFRLDGEFTVHRNVVQDHSVVALTHLNGLVAGGTSIDGGLSSTPVATEAEVFLWDIAVGERVFHTVAAPGARSVGAVCTDGRHVWGLTDTGVLIEIDPVQRRVVRTIEGAPTSTSTWGSSSFLQYRKHDGLFYGANGSRMFIFDPATEAITWNMDYLVGRLVITRRGRVYFSKGTHVYRYLPGSPRR